MTNIPITEGEINECIEDRFPGPKRKDFTYKDDEYQTRFIRFSATYMEYAKDLCMNYVIDLRRAKLTREAKRYIGVSGKQDYLAMCEDLKFLQSSMKTVLADYNDLFRKRFVERLSIRKYAAEAGVNRGVIERTQNAFYHQLAGLLYERSGRRHHKDQKRNLCPNLRSIRNRDNGITHKLYVQALALIGRCLFHWHHMTIP